MSEEKKQPRRQRLTLAERIDRRRNNRAPGRKKGQGRPRRFGGEMRDIRGLAEQYDTTETTIRSLVARGLLPHRRLSGRIVFLKSELDRFLLALPGVTADEAIQNILERRGEAEEAAR